MLCPRCRRQVERDTRTCGSCGAPLAGDRAWPLELVLPDETRVPLTGTLNVGRAADSEIRLADRTVSRHHLRIGVDDDRIWVEDAGSSHGAFLDGRRLERRTHVGGPALVQLGDVELRFERRRPEELDDDTGPGRTIVVRAGATLHVPAVGASTIDRSATSHGFRPRVRSGWALKRLGVAEGEERYVLKDLRRGEYVRMGADAAALFRLLDGSSDLAELVAEAERRLGPAGPGRLASLLADLGERGLLANVEGAEEKAAQGLAARLLRPRELTVEGAGDLFERVYRGGGYLLFTRPALAAVALVAVVGLAAFAELLVAGGTTPFVVASSIGIGGLVFLLARVLLVSLHELAHGLTLASLGRRVERAGLKLLLIFPFAFADTSESWFESRRRRLAVSAAGPASDLALGGACALGALLAPVGTARDILFQLAFAAYLGAFYNLNPLLDRDGYHMLVDLVRQPGLRRRSREHVARRLAGAGAEAIAPSRTVAIYGAALLAWSVLAIGFVAFISLRYYDRLVEIAPREIVWVFLVALYIVMFVPVLVMIGRPLAERRRRSLAGADGVGA